MSLSRTEIRGHCKIDLSPDLLLRANKAGRMVSSVARGILAKRAIDTYPTASIRLVQIHTLQELV